MQSICAMIAEDMTISSTKPYIIKSYILKQTLNIRQIVWTMQNFHIQNVHKKCICVQGFLNIKIQSMINTDCGAAGYGGARDTEF